MACPNFYTRSFSLEYSTDGIPYMQTFKVPSTENTQRYQRFSVLMKPGESHEPLTLCLLTEMFSVLMKPGESHEPLTLCLLTERFSVLMKPGESHEPLTLCRLTEILPFRFLPYSFI